MLLIPTLAARLLSKTCSVLTGSIENLGFLTSYRQGEAARFEASKALGNRKLLWHGSRLTNVYTFFFAFLVCSLLVLSLKVCVLHLLKRLLQATDLAKDVSFAAQIVLICLSVFC